jgi:hypothetical protein
MKIVIKKAGGGVAIMTVVGDADVAECLEKFKAVNPGMYVSHREMPDEAIPADRTFRDAWDDVTPEAVIDIDMEAARNIHLNRIRQVRNAELEKLDIEAIKAQDVEDAERLAEVRQRKQELRDLPETIAPQLSAATTTDELKAIQPL